MVVKVDDLAHKIRIWIVGDCCNVFVEAMTIPIRRVGIDKRMARIDARVLYEDFTHGIIINVEVVCYTVKLHTKRHLCRQKTIFHIFCQLRHGCINHEKTVSGIVAHLQHCLYLVAPFASAAQHGKVKIKIVAVLSVAKVFGAVNDWRERKTVIEL